MARITSHENLRRERSPAENCAKIRKLGFTTSRQIKMYGQTLELMSDPFEEGRQTAVRVVSRADQRERTIHLPVSILIGLADLFETPEPADPEDPVKVQWQPRKGEQFSSAIQSGVRDHDE